MIIEALPKSQSIPHQFSSQSSRASEDATASKLEGGYRKIPVLALLRAWFLTEKLLDLRIFLALHELQQRRDQDARMLAAKDQRFPRSAEPFSWAKIQTATGASKREVKSALKRLEAANLITWSPRSVTFVQGAPDNPRIRRAYESIPQKRRGRVIVPRRVLKYLAKCGSRTVIGVALAHCLRCLFLGSGGRITAEGRCSPSFVEAVFGLSKCQFKRGRKILSEVGWIVSVNKPSTKGKRERDRWRTIRWGSETQVALNWRQNAGVKDAQKSGVEVVEFPAGDLRQNAPVIDAQKMGVKETESTPPPKVAEDPAQNAPVSAAKCTRLDLNLSPPTTWEKEPIPQPVPAPEAPRPAAETPASREKDAAGAAKNGVSPSNPQKRIPQKLPHIEPDDLGSPERLKLLCDLLKKRGILQSEHDQVELFTWAAHVKQVNPKNPGALLRCLIENRKQENRAYRAMIRQSEEDRGQELRKEAEYGQRPHKVPTPAILGLTPDAQIVQKVEGILKRNPRLETSAMRICQERYGWTGEQFNTAQNELRHHQADTVRSADRPNTRRLGSCETIEQILNRCFNVNRQVIELPASWEEVQVELETRTA